MFLKRFLRVIDEEPSVLQKMASSKSKISLLETSFRSQVRIKGNVFLNTTTVSALFAMYKVFKKVKTPPDI
jgi:hypothetical protein